MHVFLLYFAMINLMSEQRNFFQNNIYKTYLQNIIFKNALTLQHDLISNHGYSCIN